MARKCRRIRKEGPHKHLSGSVSLFPFFSFNFLQQTTEEDNNDISVYDYEDHFFFHGRFFYQMGTFFHIV